MSRSCFFRRFVLPPILAVSVVAAPQASADPLPAPVPAPVPVAVQLPPADAGAAIGAMLGAGARAVNDFAAAARDQLQNAVASPIPQQAVPTGGLNTGIPKDIPAGKGIVKDDAPVKGIVKTVPEVTRAPDTVTAPPVHPESDGSAPVEGNPRIDAADEILEMPIRPRTEGPNHHWKSDPLAMVMALHPGPVLHRVAGSWFNAPDVPREAYVAEAKNMALVGPGTPLYLGEDSLCTLGAAGYDAEGNMVGITAGHCGRPGDEVLSADSWPIGTIGYVVRHSGPQDYALIRFESDKTVVSRSYNGLTVDSLGWDASTRQILCKQGVATGRTCGVQMVADQKTSLSQVCSMQGDSGGPVLDGNRMVGIVSGGLIPKGQMSCRSPLQGVLFSPMITRSIDAIMQDLDSRNGYGAGFHLPAPDGSDPQATGRS